MSQLFKEGVTKFKNTYQLLNELAGRISLKVVDQIGINATNVAMIKDKLTQLGKEINFSQDSSFTEIELGEYFALTGSGMVININSSMGEILSIVKDGLEMRLKWQQETAPLISSLGLKLSVQPGIFTPYEMNQINALIAKDGVLIKTHLGKFTTVIIGKRWDFNLSNSTILINFSASSTEIKEKLKSLSVESQELSFDPIASSISGTIAEKGFTLNAVVVDMPKNPTSLEALKNSMGFITKDSFIEILKKLKVSILQFNSRETRFVYGSKVLFLQAPVADAGLEILQRELLANEAFLLKVAISETAVKFNLQLTFSDEEISASALEDLKSLKGWLTNDLNEVLIQKSKLTLITVTRKSGPTSFKNGELTLNFNDFDPAKMTMILNPPIGPKKP